MQAEKAAQHPVLTSLPTSSGLAWVRPVTFSLCWWRCPSRRGGDWSGLTQTARALPGLSHSITGSPARLNARWGGMEIAQECWPATLGSLTEISFHSMHFFYSINYKPCFVSASALWLTISNFSQLFIDTGKWIVGLKAHTQSGMYL